MKKLFFRFFIATILVAFVAIDFSRLAPATAAVSATHLSESKQETLGYTVDSKSINTSMQAKSSIKSNLDSSAIGPTLASTVVPDYSYVKTKTDESPFSIQSDGESISTLSGSLSLSVVDMTLPGRSGLGFSLIRKYNSDDSQFYQMSSGNGFNTTSDPIEEKKFPLGKGWSWDISNIEIINNDKYLHLSGSGVFHISNSNALIGYPWKDLTFATDTTVTVNGVASAYSLKSIYKTSQFFDAQGQLIQISDTYDNKITFSYSIDPTYGSTISSISDSAGNTITITYSNTAVVLTMGTQTVTYTKIKSEGKELLSQVTDALSRVVTYDYHLTNALFNLSGPTPNTSNPYALLTGVTYSTGAKSVYTYESAPVTRYVGENAVNQAYRLKTREDRWTKPDQTQETVNHKDITYSDDFGASYNKDLVFAVTMNDGLVQTTYNNSKDYVNLDHPAVYYNDKTTEISVYGGKTYTVETAYSYDPNRFWPQPVQTRTTKSESGSSVQNITQSNFVYDDYGMILTSINPAGITTSYTYNSDHLLIGISQPISTGQTRYTEYARDPIHGNITATRIRNGDATGTVLQETLNSAYDSFGNVLQTKSLRSAGFYTTVNIAYDAQGGYPTQTSTTVKDADNVASSIVSQYTFNPLYGTLTNYKDGNGNTTAYEYDKLGRVTRQIHPDNTSIRIDYNDSLNEITQTDETGIRTYTRWNPVGWKVEEGIIKAGNDFPKAKYGYDSHGRLVRTEDALGNVTTYGYDQWSRQYLIQYPDLSTETLSYDDLNRTQTHTDATGYKLKEYDDVLGRKIKVEETKFVNGGTSTQTQTLSAFTYNNEGKVLTSTDGLNPSHTTSYGYDVLGQLTSVTNAKNETTVYQYDLLGNLALVTYPDGQKLAKTYDEIGRLIQTLNANGEIERFYYDSNGNRTQMRDRNGSRFKYTFNNRNFLKKKEIVNASGTPIAGEETISFSYDAAGKRTQMIDGTGMTTYGYNPSTGELTKVTFPDLLAIQYDYDAAGNRSTMNDPFSFNTYYHYDSRNRMDAVAPTNNFNSDYDAKYQYFGDGLLKQIKQRNGITTEYSYDGKNIQGLVEKKADSTVLHSFGYTYSANGNQLMKTEDQSTYSFSYDALNRITSSSQFAESYSYDNRGNRVGMTSTLPFESPGKNYAYDKRDRLTSVLTDVGTNVAYTYNGDGLLWERRENGTTTRYYWDGDQVIAEANVTNGTPVMKARYITGNGLIAREDNQGKAYYLQNGHGDVVELRDSTGNTRINQYSYDIFGNIVSQTEAISQPFKYSGEMTDTTTGLQYLRSRWYDPSVGRFINEDTYEGQIDNPLTLNLYTYVLNNPLIYVDPTGNWSTEITANWTINEYKLAYEKAKASGGNYQQYADAANSLRSQLIATGRYSASDIMQSTDSAIPANVVQQIAKSGVEQWAKDDPAGFGLYFKGVEVSVPTSKTEVALSFAGGLLGRIGGLQFKSQKLLDEHFDKHVVKQLEFGPITKAAYLKGAQDLYSEIADGTNILTMSRMSDKATLIYKPSSNEFLSVSSDGYIKTYFKPANGMQYWESLK